LKWGLTREDIEIQELLGPRRRTFTGEKIALDFYETDVKNVFRILREVSGQNFAIDRDVTGKVTMTLDKPVPWDQVLDLVLRMNQLGMVQEGDIIRIATAETLKREEDLRRAQLEALRKAREEVKALEPLVTKYIPSATPTPGEVRPTSKPF
jgi:type IV pilus assembly protein PilQ